MVSSTSAIGTTNYQVNALGQRIRKTNTAGDRVFHYDDQGHLIAETTAAGAPVKEYAWIGDAPLAVMDGAGYHYVHVDHLDTPRLVADAAGTTVWEWDQQEPFGGNWANENPGGAGIFDMPLRFPGQYFDAETGLHYNYFRDYSAELGRYIQPDPIGGVIFRGLALSNLAHVGLAQPQFAGILYRDQPRSNHLYGYVEANGLGFTDPFGLFVGWLWDCYKCWQHTNEMEESLRKCRNEWENCKTDKERIEYMDRYGGGFESSAIYNCAAQTNPGGFNGMVKKCGECGVSPRGPWPTKPR
jgi:RHS repeat-associated protein